MSISVTLKLQRFLIQIHLRKLPYLTFKKHIIKKLVIVDQNTMLHNIKLHKKWRRVDNRY